MGWSLGSEPQWYTHGHRTYAASSRQASREPIGVIEFLPIAIVRLVLATHLAQIAWRCVMKHSRITAEPSNALAHLHNYVSVMFKRPSMPAAICLVGTTPQQSHCSYPAPG